MLAIVTVNILPVATFRKNCVGEMLQFIRYTTINNMAAIGNKHANKAVMKVFVKYTSDVEAFY